MPYSPALRRAAGRTATLLLAAAAAFAGAVGAAPSSVALPLTGQVHFGSAVIEQTCDGNGDVTQTRLSVDYDGTGLGAPISVLASHLTSTTIEAPGPVIGTVQPGRRGTLTRTLTWPQPTYARGGVDAFAVVIRNGVGTLNENVLEVSAAHGCAAPDTTTTTSELAGPTATVSAPDCAGSVQVAVDNSASDLAWTPYVVQPSGLRSARPVVAAHAKAVVTLDLGNARSGVVGLVFRTTRPDTGWRDEYTDGGTYALAVPAAAECQAKARGAAVPVAPTRLVDTRVGTGAPKAPVAAGGRLVVQAGGKAGVPAGAEAVVVNLTALGNRTGYLQAWSAVDGPDTGSVLNIEPGRATANTVLVPLDTHGRFAVRNGSTAAVNLLVDISAYIAGGPDGSGAGDFVPQDAVRLFDSRTAGKRVPVAAGATLRVPVVGKHGITAAAGTVAARITVTGAPRAGSVTAWSGAGTAPSTSSVSFAANETTGSVSAVPVAADGTIAVTNRSTGPVHVIVDSEGWWRSGSGGTGSLVGLPARRLLDTPTDGGSLAARASRTVDVTGRPESADHLHGVAAALLSVTVVRPTAGGYLTLRLPADTGTPRTSSINFVAGRTTTNFVVAPVDDAGQIAIYNGSGGSTNVTVDMLGYVSR